MSRRLTRKWTETLEEAYGSNVGRAGELAVVQHLLASSVEEVVDYETDELIQKLGIDVSYVDPVWGGLVTVQVKENYKIEEPVVRGAPAPRYFYVEDDLKKNKTIRDIEAELMIHVNVEHSQAVLYDTQQMIDHIVEGGELFPFNYTQGAGNVRCIRFKDDYADWFKIIQLRK